MLAAEDSGQWQVRLAAGVRAQLTEWLKRAGRNETGGLLLGFAHRKRRVIYVTDALPPSPDSQGSPFAFKRGVKDYPEILDRVEASTAGLIGYVGEWHTHPDGKARLSDTDMKAVEEIRANLDSVGLPTHVMVCTEERIASFVFGGNI
jgi:integrative and conjugative element protein (TIGR02256 family)